MSFVCEVEADDTGRWLGNGMRFAYIEQALDYGRELSLRWPEVKRFRVIASTDPANAEGECHGRC